MDSNDAAEGPNITFRAENEAEGYKSRWLWSLSQFREAFDEWQNGEGQKQYGTVSGCMLLCVRKIADWLLEIGG